MIVVHSCAAATSDKDWIVPVQRFPSFRGAFKVTLAGKADTVKMGTKGNKRANLDN